MHPLRDSLARVMVDASDIAIGAVLQQFVGNEWQTLAFFSQKLTSPETRYNTFGPELFAIYATIKHFRHFLEGHKFHVVMDNKPLTFVFPRNQDSYTVRGLSHLSSFWNSPPICTMYKAVPVLQLMHSLGLPFCKF